MWLNIAAKLVPGIIKTGMSIASNRRRTKELESVAEMKHAERMASGEIEYQKAVNDIKTGKVNIFAGPLVDNTGKEIIPAGKTLDDGALWGMNYYLKGVNGKIPG